MLLLKAWVFLGLSKNGREASRGENRYLIRHVSIHGQEDTKRFGGAAAHPPCFDKVEAEV